MAALILAGVSLTRRGPLRARLPFTAAAALVRLAGSPGQPIAAPHLTGAARLRLVSDLCLP